MNSSPTVCRSDPTHMPVITKRSRPPRRGGQMMEFALLMPLFLGLLFLVWDAGTGILYRSQVINEAYVLARAGAQYGQLPPQSDLTIRAQQDLIVTGTLPPSDIRVEIPGGARWCTTADDTLRVKVFYTYNPPFDFFGLFTDIQMAGEGVARCEVVR